MTRFTPLALVAAALTLSACATTTTAAPPQDKPDEPIAEPTTMTDDTVRCTDGKAGEFDCSNVDLLAHMPLDTFDASTTRGNDIWGWTDATTGNEYALVGLDNGTAFVDITTPTAPVYIGFLPTETTATTWRDIKTYADHAYIVSEAPGHGIQVFDLTHLRGLSGPAERFTADAVYKGVSNVHNIVIDEQSGFAYAVGATSVGDDLPPACSAPGFHAVDIRTPKSPTFAGCFSDADADASPVSAPGYTHDAQCLVYDGPDTDYTGRQLCFASNEDVVTVFDVEDKSNVKMISQAAYPKDAYTHQGWLTEDQRYFLANDELDEVNGLVSTQRTLVFDMSDLDAPEFAFAHDSGITVIDHNLYMLGNLSYQSNYEAGLRILDASAIAEGRLTEVGYFDTFPTSQSVQFGGQWSNFPYFESGTVIANDGANGLFVLRPTLDSM